MTPYAPTIAPSLLSADFARLASEVAAVEQAGVTVLHLDVMDGHFVPNITFGPPLVASLRPVSKMVFDTHLMFTDPLKYAEPFAKAGSDWISFHLEAPCDPSAVIDRIVACGAKPGMVVNPDTPVSGLRPYLSRLHHVLVMSVFPGFGGQKFIGGVCAKFAELRDMGFEGRLEIDGGINVETAAEAARAGADLLVAGNSVYGAKDRTKAVRDILASAASAAVASGG